MRCPNDGWAAAVGDMPKDDSGLFLARSLKFLQENIRRSGPAALASYTLIGAIIVLGGLGYFADRWLGTSPWLLLAGLLLGIVVGFYELAMVVWGRRTHEPPDEG